MFKQTKPNLKPIWVTVSFITCFILLAVAGMLFSATAEDSAQKGIDHEIYYTQADLARLIEQASQEHLEPDYSVYANTTAVFEVENRSGKASVNTGSQISEWLGSQLNGNVLIDIISEPDGCTAYLSFNPEKLSFSVYTINPSSDSCKYNIVIEDTNNALASFQVYSLKPVLEDVIEPAPQQEPENSSSVPQESSSVPLQEISEPVPAEQPDSSISSGEPEESQPDSSQPITNDESAPPKPQEPQDESEIPNEQQPISQPHPEENNEEKAETSPIPDLPAAALMQTKYIHDYFFSDKAVGDIEAALLSSEETTEETTVATQNTETVVEDVEIVTEQSDSNISAKSGISMDVPANGMANVEINVGMIYGGMLPGNAVTYANLSSETIKTSSSGNYIDIYSKGDTTVGGKTPNTSGDYATLSTSYHSVYYDLNLNTIISAAYSSILSTERLTINLYNSQPVSIKQIYYNKLKNKHSVIITTPTPGTTLAIHNPFGSSFVGSGNTYVKNGAIVHSKSGMAGFGFTAEDLENANLFVENSSILTVSGPYGGIGDSNKYSGVKNVVASGGGTIIADGMNEAGNAIKVWDEVYTHSNGCIDAKNAKCGIYAKVIASNGGTQTFGTDESILDSKKSRISGEGTVTGIEVTDHVYSGTGSIIIAKGVEQGIIAPPTTNFYNTDISNSSNSEIGREKAGYGTDEYKGLLAHQYGTIFAKATGSNGVGYLCPTATGIKYTNIFYKNRIVAIGGKYGFMSTANGTELNLKPKYYGEIIAVGGEAGIWAQTSNFNANHYTYVRADNGGRIYARGGTCGIFNEYGCTQAHCEGDKYPNTHGGSHIVGIGGISDEYMDKPMDYGEQDFFNLPLPVPDEEGLLPFKKNTYGIHNKGYGYITSYDVGSTVKMYGGEYGGRTGYDNAPPHTLLSGTYIAVHEGGYMEAHGGHYGAVANSYIHVLSWDTIGSSLHGDSQLKAYGEKVGIWGTGNYGDGVVSTFPATTRAGRSYIYGYGRETGIRAKGNIKCYPNTYIMGETVISQDAKYGPEATPAIQWGYNNSSGRGVMLDGLVHEMYRIENFEIPVNSSTPYVINREIAAIGTNMGTDPNAISAYDWTTPTEHPSTSEDGYDWVDYDKDDNNPVILSVVPFWGGYGLKANQSVKDVTIVANSKTTKSTSSTGFHKFNDSFKPSESGTYRITINKKLPASKNCIYLNVPDLHFGTHKLSAIPSTLFQNDDFVISITDNRKPQKDKWKLSVAMTKKLTSTTNTSHILDNVVKLKTGSGNAISLDSNLNQNFDISTQPADLPRQTDITWSNSNKTGIYLEIPTGAAYREKYVGSLTWTLTNTL